MVVLLVFITFVIAIAIDLVIVKIWAEKKARQMIQSATPETVPVSTDQLQSPFYPEKLHFDKGHTWAMIEKAAVSVGLDDFAQRFAGKIDKIDSPNVGDVVKKGQPIWVLHFGDRSIIQRAPISGRIIQINKEVLRDPSIANLSPYGEGWILKIMPQSVNDEVPELLDQKQFLKWNDRVKTRLLEEIHPELGMVYGDTSELRPGAGRNINEKEWDQLVDLLFYSKDE